VRRLAAVWLLALSAISARPAQAAYRSSSSNSGTSTTRSCTVPPGVAADDIIIIMLSADGTSSTATNGTVPTGFTAFFNNTDVTADSQTVSSAWKRATGADSGSYSFGTSTGAGSNWMCQAVVLSGRDTGNPPVAGTSSIQNTGQSSPVTVSANGVTALSGDDLVWFSAPDPTATGVVTGHTPPSSYTERQDANNGWTSMSIATLDAASAGATGTISGTLTLSSNTSGYLSLLIRIPAAGGAVATPRRRPLVFQ